MRRHRKHSHYFEKLNAILETIFERSVEQEMDLYQLADKAGLCSQTVFRFIHGETELPRLKTIIALAKAVGLEVDLVIEEARRVRKVA